MKNLILFLVLGLFMALGCASGGEPETGEQISQEPRGAVYKTKKCNNLENFEERRKCGDTQLMADLVAKLQAVESSETLDENAKLVIEFYVTEKGKPDSVRLTRNINELIDKTAIKFIKRTKWAPAMSDGRYMKIKKRLPIQFNG